jgi:hypothetical protein
MAPDSGWVNTLPPALPFGSTSLGAPAALAAAYEKLGMGEKFQIQRRFKSLTKDLFAFKDYYTIFSQ